MLNNIQVIFNEYYLFVQSSGSAQEDDRITLRITEDADYASNKGQYVALNLGIPQKKDRQCSLTEFKLKEPFSKNQL